MGTDGGPRRALARLHGAAEDGTLAALTAEHGLGLLVVFGSAAEGVAEPGDIDIAVEGDGELDRLRLHRDLVALTGTEAVDVMDLRRAGTVARSEALGHGYPLHESYDGRFADAQMVAVTAYLDSRWLRELDMRVLAAR